MQLVLIARIAVGRMLLLLGLCVQLAQGLNFLLQSELFLFQAACLYF